MTRRHLYFAVVMFISVLLYWTTLKKLVSSSFHSEYYPYIGVTPLLSAALIYWGKNRIFSHARKGFGFGLALVFLAFAIHWCATSHVAASSPSGLLSLMTLSLIVLWVGLFATFYGNDAVRAGAFPLAFLLMMVPLPPAVLERAIPFLQGCSTQAAGVFLRLGGVPVFQNGFRFSLPGMDLEVARQCSGIRSGLSLFITSLLMGHVFLASPWRKLWLALAGFPITVFKNGLRIVTIYWLTGHPSLAPLTMWVHRYAGIPFSILGLLLLALLAIALRRFDAIGSVSILDSPDLKARQSHPWADQMRQS